MLSVILELVANILDISVLTILFCKRLLPKYDTIIPTISFMILGVLLESVPIFIDINHYPTEVILFALCFMYLAWFRQGTLLHKLFWVSISFVMIFAIAIAVIPALSKISHIDAEIINNPSDFSSRVLYIVIVNIIKYTVFYLMAYKRRKTYGNSVSIFMCLFTPLTCVVFGTIIYSVFLKNGLQLIADDIIFLISTSYLLISIFSFVMYEFIEREAERKYYLIAKETQHETMSQFTDQIKQTNQEIIVWQHDMKQHLNCLQSLIEKKDYEAAGDYLNRFTDKIQMSYLKINSGNYIADAVLSSKIRLATEKGIKVECSASVPEILSIDDVDFCSILSNIFDNAIEAAGKVHDASYVNCDIITIRNQLVIEIENSSNGEYKCRNGIFESQKTNGIHGIGLRHTQSIVDQYEGFCSIDAGKDKFKISISIPIMSK